MNKLSAIFDNKILLVAMMAWIISQAIKVISTMIKTKKLDFDRLMGAGGMPSSHTATAIAASVAAGQTMGYDSAVFGIALVISFVVMYDATGIRRAAGKQAEILNEIVEKFRLHEKINYPEKLKELLGHTLLEVFAGAILGIILGILFTI